MTMTEDPDRIVFADLPGFGKDRNRINWGSRSFQDDNCIVFGLLGGEFVSAWGADSSEADHFMEVISKYDVVLPMTHTKLYLQNQYTPEELDEFAAGIERLKRTLGGIGAFDYDSWHALSEENPDAYDAVREAALGTWNDDHPEPVDDSSDEWYEWQDLQDAVVEQAVDALWQEVTWFRRNLLDLCYGDEDGEGHARDQFELPGRAWPVNQDDGTPALLVSFWGSSQHPELEAVLARIRHEYGLPDGTLTYFEDTVDDEWMKAGGGEPEAPAHDPAVVDRIRRLMARMHVAGPEEKEKIRAEVAQLRAAIGAPVDPKAGAGSKRAGRSASAAGFDHAAGFHAAHRTEAIIAALETAAR